MYRVHRFMWLGFCCFGLLLTASGGADIPRVILDTDMRADCDDAGALALLHALADNGECEILAVMASTTGPHVASTIGAINNFYGRPELPVGLYGGVGLDGSDDYAPVVGDPNWFPNRVSNATATESTALYRKLLHESPDDSVSIVVIGGQPCVHGLLVSEADYEGDGSINRTGRELIADKVRELVLMAGSFDESGHREWNVILDVPAAQRVAEEWPGRVVFSGFEIGVVIQTGSALEDPLKNPVAKSYELYRGAGGMGNIGNRSSWDQAATYYTVLGAEHAGETIWNLEGPVSVTYSDEGHTIFEEDPDADRYYKVQVMSVEDTEDIIEALMVQPPRARVTLKSPANGAAYTTGARIPTIVAVDFPLAAADDTLEDHGIAEISYLLYEKDTHEGTTRQLRYMIYDAERLPGFDMEQFVAEDVSHADGVPFQGRGFVTADAPISATGQAYMRLKNGAEFYGPLSSFTFVPETAPIGDNEQDENINLALLDSATLSGSVPEGEGRGALGDILYDPANDAYANVTDWNEYGVVYQEDLGLVTEEDPFYWQAAWDSPKNINEITFGGTHNNQPQPFTQWKVQYRLDGTWHTLQEGQGGWINTGVYHWRGVDDAHIVADAVRVIAYADGEHPLHSIHLRARGGVSNNDDDSATEPKVTMIRYR